MGNIDINIIGMSIGKSQPKKKKENIYVTSQLCDTAIGATQFIVHSGTFAWHSNTSTTAIFRRRAGGVRRLLMHRRNIGDTLIQGEWEIYQSTT